MTGKRTFRFFIGLCLLGTTFLPASPIARSPFFQSQEDDKASPVPKDAPKTAPTDFQAALKAAEGLKASTEGAAYEKDFGETTRRWLASDIARCAKAFGGTAFGPFTVLIQVGPSGRADKVLAWPETHIADCLRLRFASADYPKPPGPSWWVKMDIRIDVKNSKSGTSKAPLDAQAAAGIVYGGELAVLVAAPKEWVLDNKSGVSQGLHAVLYPRGSTWQKAPEVMYVNVTGLDPGETLDMLIAADIAKFKKEFSGISIEELEPVVIRNGIKAQVRSYIGGGYPSYECVAYAQHGTRVALYVLNCRDKKGYEKTLALFKEMVAASLMAKMVFDGKTPRTVPLDSDAPVNPAQDKPKEGDRGGPPQPALNEVPAKFYVLSRFRFFDTGGTAFRKYSDVREAMFATLPKTTNEDWAGAIKKVLPYEEAYRRLNNELAEDEQKIAGELGADEMPKLGPFLGQADRYAEIHVEELESILRFLTKMADCPSDTSPFATSKEELGRILADMKSTQQRFSDELEKLGQITLRVARNPESSARRPGAPV